PQLRKHPRAAADDRVPLLRLEPGSGSPAGQHQARLLDHQTRLRDARFGHSAGEDPPRHPSQRVRFGSERPPSPPLRRHGLRPAQGQAQALLALRAERLAAGAGGRSLMGDRLPIYRDQAVTVYAGDVREVLASLPDASIDSCVTSPPYWGLRDYGIP